MTKATKEEIVKSLYMGLKKNELPDLKSELPFYYDEGTGTYYMLTGKSQMDRPNIELAKKYFEDAIIPLRRAVAGTDDYRKALYCAIAVECIDHLLKEPKSNKE